SLLGQLLHTTAAERKTLLAAGAATGMTATVGSPVSAVELLLFELRPRSLIPVALAAAAATGIGAVAVGICGYFVPRTLGVGYDNIDRILSADIGGEALLLLAVVKFISWSISLGSGTSGGTLAPLFTIGGGLGALLGEAASRAFPHLGIDVRIAALVGMAAMFAGASRALLTSVVFAFETTRQPIGLLPLLGGCTAAFLFSCLLMRNPIMTEKIARRGVRVPGEYAADFLDQVTAGLAAARPVVTLKADDLLEQVRAWIATRGAGTSHQGFPVVEANGELMGVVTRRDLLDPKLAEAGGTRLREGTLQINRRARRARRGFFFKKNLFSARSARSAVDPKKCPPHYRISTSAGARMVASPEGDGILICVTFQP
ncbi:MAG TPA: chloride channel protein, partial [Myxococcales bacterium]